MAAEASTGRFRPAAAAPPASASARVALAAAGLTVVHAALEPAHLTIWIKEP
jgi:hypothetical protein